MAETYTYRVRDQRGKVATGTLVAENEHGGPDAIVEKERERMVLGHPIRDRARDGTPVFGDLSRLGRQVVMRLEVEERRRRGERLSRQRREAGQGAEASRPAVASGEEERRDRNDSAQTDEQVRGRTQPKQGDDR